MKNKNLLFTMIALIAALAVPLLIKAPYQLHMVILILIWATIGTAWNLLGGYGGQVSFGHAAFFGIGAYSAGMLNLYLEISPWWGLLLGPIAATLIAYPIGLICFRLRGPYFALAMLALGEIFRILFTNLSVTQGAQGILIMPEITSKVFYYYIGLGILALTLLTTYKIVNSKIGYYLVSIREDQDAATSLGIPTTTYKIIALLPSAFYTGLAGAFYMNYVAFVDPKIAFNLVNVSIMIILVVMLGGPATTWGPTIGAAIYIILGEVFRATLGAANVLVFGLLVCVIIMFMPNGIIGTLTNLGRLLKQKKGWPGGTKHESV
ncbi:branched-chain amino acid ABC transporter permease [Desulfitobacterium chlororespirans]|uniref:Amino acid/amide ABC transporter membrane protein 2, HAAT family n=1 Tax=Desulfitobacterium chlororespirans DSM 11544 TaxID=1121395 RepID=A0A1M7UBS7_9FIRM|nr:branched-chain amino acid ABC transporter permease [Desulfitobacterium chlororespirans]SHN80368.1 amino acid/amide ABC transporter membrane protein 2, HAAT family [Desulfitobacterium chlororespirans DSM 11544]